jgi:hypothetical protein
MCNVTGRLDKMAALVLMEHAPARRTTIFELTSAERREVNELN